jgi:hypothetical protein
LRAGDFFFAAPFFAVLFLFAAVFFARPLPDVFFFDAYDFLVAIAFSPLFSQYSLRAAHATRAKEINRTRGC